MFLTEPTTIPAAAWKTQVSQSTSVGDYNLGRDELPLYFDNVEGGAATASYDTVTNSWNMAVTSGTDYAIFQTKQRHPYYPGNAQQPEYTYINLEPETNVVKRVGYFSSSTTAPYDTSFDGIYLESANGVINFVVSRNGTELYRGDDLSGLIDWTNFNVSLNDFLYLGGTSVNHYQIYEGKLHTFSTYHHASKVDGVIMDHPAQPIRAEIRSAGGSGSFKFLCARVASSGLLSDSFGTPVHYDSGAAQSVATATTEMLLALRKNNRTVEYFPRRIAVASTDANGLFRWRLSINPTLSLAPTYAALTNQFLDGAMDDGITLTANGHVIGEGVATGRVSEVGDISQALRIGENIAGTYDELVLSVENLAGGAQTMAASIGGFIV